MIQYWCQSRLFADDNIIIMPLESGDRVYDVMSVSQLDQVPAVFSLTTATVSVISMRKPATSPASSSACSAQTQSVRPLLLQLQHKAVFHTD